MGEAAVRASAAPPLKFVAGQAARCRERPSPSPKTPSDRSPSPTTPSIPKPQGSSQKSPS
eukprot:1948745-Pyramimonas_sp.AAC.1